MYKNNYLISSLKYRLENKKYKDGCSGVTFTFYDQASEKVGEFSLFDWEDGLNIENLFVEPRFRRMGVATYMLQIAIDLGAKNISVEKTNGIAVYLYSKMGFEVSMHSSNDCDLLYMTINKKKPLLNRMKSGILSIINR